MKIIYDINETVYDFKTKLEIVDPNKLTGYMQRDLETGKMFFYEYPEEKQKQVKIDYYRCIRQDMFDALNIFFGVYGFGLEDITDEEHAEIADWYQKLKDVTEDGADDSCLEYENIPERVKYYYDKTTSF